MVCCCYCLFVVIHTIDLVKLSHVSVALLLWVSSSYSSEPAMLPATVADHRTAPPRPPAWQLWHPPVSTGHSFSPPSLAHDFFQRSASGRYRPLPGMVSSSRILRQVSGTACWHTRPFSSDGHLINGSQGT